MQRIAISSDTPTSLVSSSTVDQMISIEGGSCRIYTGTTPADRLAGHLVSGGYQIIVPAGVGVSALAEAGASVTAVVGDFGT